MLPFSPGFVAQCVKMSVSFSLLDFSNSLKDPQRDSVGGIAVDVTQAPLQKVKKSWLGAALLSIQEVEIVLKPFVGALDVTWIPEVLQPNTRHNREA